MKKPDSRKYKQTDTWAKWRMIFDEADHLMKDYYYCSCCSAIYNVNITNSGKCLKIHAMECVPIAKENDRIDTHFSSTYHPNKKRKILIEDRKSITQAAINFVVNDLRPICSVEGDGLNNLLSKMTFIGVKYGAMSVKDLEASRLIPSRQTVSHSSFSFSFMTVKLESNNIYMENIYS